MHQREYTSALLAFRNHLNQLLPSSVAAIDHRGEGGRHVSSLMAKECRKLSPSTDLQCIAITPGAPLSPSPKNEKKNENT
jgi:hypothetical protein